MGIASRFSSPAISISAASTNCGRQLMHTDPDLRNERIACPGSSRGATTSEASALHLSLRPLRRFLEDAATTELCINQPGEIFVESREGWHREALAEVT